MMKKKGFEIQFNWIFILVAGAAILLFFTVIVVKQKNISEISAKSTVLKSIEAIISGASISTDTTNTIDIPNSNIEVSCNRVSLGKVSKQYQNLILFAPSLIKGNKLLTQTFSFSIPFKATNLLYISSPQIRYIIIGSNDLAKEINRSLHSGLKKESYQSIPTIRNENNYKVKIIVFGVIDVNNLNLINLQKIPDSDVTAIKITGDIEKGGIEFYEKSASSWASKGSSPYLTKSALLGAIYSDTKENYECNMKNVFSKLALVTRIYTERTNNLNNIETRRECKQSYNNALQHLRVITSNLATSNLDSQKINSIASAAESLIIENKNAQQYSCPLIY